MRQAQSDAAFAEGLRVSREAALDMARSAAVDASKKVTGKSDAGIIDDRSIRMSEVKENVGPPQSADSHVVDGEALIRRLQSNGSTWS